MITKTLKSNVAKEIKGCDYNRNSTHKVECRCCHRLSMTFFFSLPESFQFQTNNEKRKIKHNKFTSNHSQSNILLSLSIYYSSLSSSFD